jgi:hypothetical protein
MMILKKSAKNILIFQSQVLTKYKNIKSIDTEIKDLVTTYNNMNKKFHH